MSLVAEGLHYLVDSRGIEELYDLAADPRELRDLRNDPGRNPALGRFRNSLDEILRDSRVTSPVSAAYAKQLRKVLGSLNRRPPVRKPVTRNPLFPPLGTRPIAAPVPTSLRSDWEGHGPLEGPSSHAIPA